MGNTAVPEKRNLGLLYLLGYSCPNIYGDITTFTDHFEHLFACKTTLSVSIYQPMAHPSTCMYTFTLTTGYSEMNKMKSHRKSWENIRIQPCLCTNKIVPPPVGQWHYI